MKRLQCFRVKSVNGQSLAEYGLVLALLAVVAIGGLNALGTSLQGVLAGLVSQMGGQSPNAPAVASAGGGSSSTVTPVVGRSVPSPPGTASTAGGSCGYSGCNDSGTDGL
ncbi:hypothetical protein [Vampirovibrio chlorellavorus]|uniref:hypothetical protein n=1 Tax=Vampirovibrio chlorellavorus TaxID=758823 RepID=UPI0026F066CF|nr:hypothetical protein [Vampirovibrio chlorellavorus]